MQLKYIVVYVYHLEEIQNDLHIAYDKLDA